MAIELTMPRLSDTMESGTIIKWNVKEGDAVSAGDVVADVETDKATMEMQVYDDGKVSRIVVPEGKTVAVGTLIAVIDDGSGEAAAPAAPEAAAPAKPAAPASSVAGEASRMRVSPVARRLADEHGVELGSIRGSGPAGRIVKQDVLAAIENRAAPGTPRARVETSAARPVPAMRTAVAASTTALSAPGRPGGEVPLSGMRQTIARRLV